MNNKSGKYLELEKNKTNKINEWLEFLKSNNNELILMQTSRTFASSLYNILYSMQQEINDKNIEQQMNYVNTIGQYINNKDFNKVLSIVQKIKEIDANGINLNNIELDKKIEEIDKKLKDLEYEEAIINNSITINLDEYEKLKKYQKEYLEFENTDMAIKIYQGTILPIEHPDYYKNRIKIEVLSNDNYFIQIDNKEYKNISSMTINKINNLINNNLKSLIECSLCENKQFLLKNKIHDNSMQKIIIKYGKVLINIDGKSSNQINKFCAEFIKYVIDIINANNAIEEERMKQLMENPGIRNLDSDLIKYCNLYKERFGKNINIPNNELEKIKLIDAIKLCFDKNEDALDKLLNSGSN